MPNNGIATDHRTHLDPNVDIGDLREHLAVGGVKPLLLQCRLATPLAPKHVQCQQRAGQFRHGGLSE